MQSNRKLNGELIRKGLHLLIVLVPPLAAINLSHTTMLLLAGFIIYICAESLRFLGFSPPLISPITRFVLRQREEGRFALGPVTLGLGALLSLLLFPPKAAALAIYVLAFADCSAGLVGQFLGRHRPSLMAGKSVEGTLAGFIAAALAGLLLFRDIKIALAAGVISIIIDLLPLGDFDNLILPLAVGMAAVLIYP